jgi:hypothetical protein
VITDNSYLAIELQRLAEGDALGKALLLVSRAKSKIPPDLTFSAVRIWPALEPPQEADQLCLGFAEQGPSGQNILENWRQEGRALVEALVAQLKAGAVKQHGKRGGA